MSFDRAIPNRSDDWRLFFKVCHGPQDDNYTDDDDVSDDKDISYMSVQ